MPEPFKNLFSEKAIRAMAHHLVRVTADFDGEGFIALAINDLDNLELKQRSSQITKSLKQFLPEDFPRAVKILVSSLDPITNFSISEMEHGSTPDGIRGWPVMAMADYVAWHGQNHLELSLDALREMTMRSSSELAIRHFIQNYETRVMEVLSTWVNDQNYHVRRLVSEGTRPRLPWAMQLPEFIKDPSSVLPLLERLKDDNEEYVRRSVANNLNDIAKDHPDVVADIAKKWMVDTTPERKKLIRHALRTLIKSGHPGALKALGYGPPNVTVSHFDVLTKEVTLGNALEFELEIASNSTADQPLVIDYVIHHRRANGKTTPKVFKWKNITLKAGAKNFGIKRHAIRPITTRRYYAGQHRIEISINGQVFCGKGFFLHKE